MTLSHPGWPGSVRLAPAWHQAIPIPTPQLNQYLPLSDKQESPSDFLHYQTMRMR